MAGKAKAPESNERPVLIVKRKGGHGDHGHHGGAWKVAYADFVTAMMAFFLLLWLLNVTTEEQKLGIANYFMPDSVSRSNSGGGGVLGGQTISPGEMTRVAGGLVMSIPMKPEAEEAEDPADTADESQPPERNQPKVPGQRVLADGRDVGPDVNRDANRDVNRDVGRHPNEKEIQEARVRQEEEAFKKAEFDLKQAIQDIPELRQLAQNLIIDRTPEGLRIQIVDQGRYSMFPLGSASPLDHTKKLMNLVAQVVQKTPNKIAVTGHTDSLPFANANGAYGNWELSTDRANSSRRLLTESGMPAARISRVVGKADQDPLFAENPADPRNRRISIVLLRDQPVVAN
jgi:chemotaxis protein MotB